MRCCGLGHFGKCTEEGRCFVCTGEHEGSQHHCSAEGCGKKSERCEHRAAKCANCEGPHVATSIRCPERRSSRKTTAKGPTEMRSSPPAMEMDQGQDDLPVQEDQAEREATASDPDQTTPVQVMPISSDTEIHQPLPRGQGLRRPTRELRSMTRALTGATHMLSSLDDPIYMFINDDSAAT